MVRINDIENFITPLNLKWTKVDNLEWTKVGQFKVDKSGQLRVNKSGQLKVDTSGQFEVDILKWTFGSGQKRDIIKKKGGESKCKLSLD